MTENSHLLGSHRMGRCQIVGSRHMVSIGQHVSGTVLLSLHSTARFPVQVTSLSQVLSSHVTHSPAHLHVIASQHEKNMVAQLSTQSRHPSRSAIHAQRVSAWGTVMEVNTLDIFRRICTNHVEFYRRLHIYTQLLYVGQLICSISR